MIWGYHHDLGNIQFIDPDYLGQNLVPQYFFMVFIQRVDLIICGMALPIPKSHWPQIFFLCVPCPCHEFSMVFPMHFPMYFLLGGSSSSVSIGDIPVFFRSRVDPLINWACNLLRGMIHQVWLVVDLPLWKIWVRLDHHPNYWGKYNSCSKPPTRHIFFSYLLPTFELYSFLQDVPQHSLRAAGCWPLPQLAPGRRGPGRIWQILRPSWGSWYISNILKCVGNPKLYVNNCCQLSFWDVLFGFF